MKLQSKNKIENYKFQNWLSEVFENCVYIVYQTRSGLKHKEMN